jgi:hypothetical protein
MKKQISKILTYLLFLQSLFFQVDLPELVLCFGDDGHVAIEVTSEADCVYDNDTPNTKASAFQVLNEKHDDCNDLKLDLHFSNADVNKNKTNLLKHIAYLHLPSFFSQNKQSQNANQKIQTTTNKQTINTIHNTILLI